MDGHRVTVLPSGQQPFAAGVNDKVPRSLHPGRDNLHQGEQAVLLYLINGDCILAPAGDLEEFFILGKVDIRGGILRGPAIFQCGESLKKRKVSIFIR